MYNKEVKSILKDKSIKELEGIMDAVGEAEWKLRELPEISNELAIIKRIITHYYNDNWDRLSTEQDRKEFQALNDFPF